MPKKSKRQHAQRHIDKKLRNRLLLYFLISIVLVGVVFYEMITGVVSFPLAVLGVIAGIFVGTLTARMYHISWDHDAKKIVSRLDLFGGVILVLYILFAIFRGRIIEHFIHGPAVGGISISIVAGIMIGRVLGTRGKIGKILHEQKILK